MSTGRDIARGIAWRRMIARIADRRVARQKTQGPRSKPTEVGLSGVQPDTWRGSPGVIVESYIQAGADPMPGYSAQLVSQRVKWDWPVESTSFDTAAGAPVPVVGNRPPLM